MRPNGGGNETTTVSVVSSLVNQPYFLGGGENTSGYTWGPGTRLGTHHFTRGQEFWLRNNPDNV